MTEEKAVFHYENKLQEETDRIRADIKAEYERAAILRNQEFDSQLNEYRDMIDALNSNLAESQNQVENLQRVNEHAVNDFITERDSLNTKIELCNREIALCNGEIEVLQGDKAMLNGKIEDLQSDKAMLNQELESFYVDVKVDMVNDQHKLINSLAQMPIVKLIRNLYVARIPAMSDSLNRILRYNLSDKLYSVTFNEFGSEDIDITPYLESLKIACSKATKRIYIKCLEMSANQFSEIIKSSSQCEEVVIAY